MLEVSNLQAYYGKSHVLHGVDLRVGQGEIVSLLGRNGVGRSTTAKAIMGLVDCTGRIVFKDKDLTRLKTYEIAQLGVGYVPESRDIFPTLTVEENLRLGLKGKAPGRWTYEDMYALFPRLRERQQTQAGVLSGGEQQMLTLARTMMGDPELVIIDEPTEGLAPLIVEMVANFLRALKERGISILLIEQKLTIALQISQRVYVMGHGHMVFEGTPEDLKRNKLIRQEWLEV
ncbi:ABC transporter ATP-binding protein [Betaproteobacteria bacterium PRO7]|jgi:branched-chain amino acid transport system ATP-binding protein|nr:ABC transporter ATP-binding protein [Betaproteobacteria bacterium PRO7]GIL04526.1 MAG: ABC transporter ATP-binding protein [Betaproteobacteria bacterium]